MHSLNQGELAQGNPSRKVQSRQTQVGIGEEKHWWDTEDPVTQGHCLWFQRRCDGFKVKESYLAQGQDLCKLEE